MSATVTDVAHMAEALRLAKQARPSPNPRVGAVIVQKDGTVVGRGFHRHPGEPHAEILALNEAGFAAKGATLYVTLEPCVHYGRTGPCADAVISAGISRVVVGTTDPDPRVNGAGVTKIKDAGIDVTVGVGEDDCKRLLAGYITHRTAGRPRVTVKAAISLDGYLATSLGDSKWISSEASRRLVHEMRADTDAVAVGIQTVIADDPSLTVRDVPGCSPVRLVLDSTLRIPMTSGLVRNEMEPQVILAYTHASDETLRALERKPHISLLQCTADEQGRTNIDDLLQKLGAQGILSLLVEGGSRIISSFFHAEMVDDLVLFIAPKILGAGIPWTNYPQASTVAGSLRLSPIETALIGDDILYRATVIYPVKNP